MPLHAARQLHAGIDIGGTNIRCALAGDAPGQMLSQKHAKTPAAAGAAAILECIDGLLKACLHDAGQAADAVAAIGCVAPGITDPAAGMVYDAPNLAGWRDVPLAAMLEDRFGVPVAIENDVKAAALGEYAHGAGRSCGSLVYLTVSTGVAAGIVVGGNVLRGHHHAAGEIGLLLPDRSHIDDDWRPQGCLELMAGGVGLARAWAERRGGPPTPDGAIRLFEAARAGDVEARALVQRAADYLAQAAVALGAIVDPEVIALGGGIALNEPVIAERIRAVVAATLPHTPRVVEAALGGDAPLVGALTLAAQQAGRKT